MVPNNSARRVKMFTKDSKPANGIRLTRSLFFETNRNFDTREGVRFTLKKRDHSVEVNGETVVYPSLYRLFLEEDDITEYNFAIKYFGSWDYWDEICNSTWFKPHIANWRRELEARTRARALINIKEMALDPDHKQSFQASKFMLDGDWTLHKNSKRPPRGRPSKQEIENITEEIINEEKTIRKDLERLN